jgi:hypothetical protein
MKKRWLLNLILLAVVAGLVTFLYTRPKNETVNNSSYEVSSYKMAEFNAIKVEFPAKAAVTFEKVDGFWRLTAPYKTRADLASVQRILSIIAASSPEKLSANDLAKYGLDQPSIKLTLYRDQDNSETFLFGTHSPLTDDQYVAHKDAVYLISNTYGEAAATQTIELVDKAPLKPTEKVVGFDFSRLEQWEQHGLNLDMVEGQWKVSIAKAKPTQNELNEWLDFSWLHTSAKSVEFYNPDRKTTYPSFKVKMADGSKVHFDKIQESPELIIGRPDEGLMYFFPPDEGFTMLNPPINMPSE